MSASIRGDKGHVRILRDGAVVAISEITDIDFSENSQEHESYYVGQSKPETDVLTMGWNGSFSC